MPDEPKIHDADRPSETAGLPEMGDGASARHYLRDVDTKNSEADTREPADADLDQLAEDPSAPGGEGKPVRRDD